MTVPWKSKGTGNVAMMEELRWRNEVLKELEGFIDGEAKRVGEQGGKGWKLMGETTDAFDHPKKEEEANEGELFADISNRFQRWEKIESYLTADHSHPSRTMELPEDEIVKDPFRVPFFSDVKSTLFIVQSPQAKVGIALSFLKFLGLEFGDNQSNDPWLNLQFFNSESIRSNFFHSRFLNHQSSDSIFSIIQGEAMESPRNSSFSPFDSPFRSFPFNKYVMFSSPSCRWFECLSEGRMKELDGEMITRVFELLDGEFVGYPEGKRKWRDRWIAWEGRRGLKV
jgi:hypothetical protein